MQRECCEYATIGFRMMCSAFICSEFTSGAEYNPTKAFGMYSGLQKYERTSRKTTSKMV